MIILMSWLSKLNPFSSENSIHSEYELKEIPLEDVVGNPYQPRSHIDEDSLQELATSIREYGVITPIQVTETENDTYQLIAGERRVRASRIIGLETIPALIRDYNEDEIIEVSFLENLQREPMNAVDKATMYERLRSEFKNLSLEELGELIGKSPEEIKEFEWILDLSSVVQQALSRNIIDREIARSIKDLSKKKQHSFVSFLVQEEPSPSDIEEKISQLKEKSEEDVQETATQDDGEDLEDTFDEDLSIPGELQEREN
ncbi:MAG: ParB/RepB/Spo0J family partition protein [bacterium]